MVQGRTHVCALIEQKRFCYSTVSKGAPPAAWRLEFVDEGYYFFEGH